MSDPANLPVTLVVLYSSGVAYFQHTGQITGSASAELRFKSAQINDVLKSLVLQDTGGGVFGTVVYPSHDPVAKTLKSFQVDLTDNPSLPALLNQLRGAVVAADLTTETLTGAILGLEKRPKPLERGSIEIWVLNLLVNGSIRALPLESISSLTLQDPRLQQDLASALSVVSQTRDHDKKPVTLNFTGEGQRQVRIGYVVEAPVWKTSYRLILPPEGSQDSAHLQGWAIIENQTDNDWPSITLSLVSGRPISFIQELYEPTYIPRPVVHPDLFTGLRPQLYSAGLPMAPVAAAPAAVGGAGPTAAAMRSRAAVSKMAVASVPAPYVNDADFSASVNSQVQSADLGELFQFTVPNISLPRQRSAMIPIVTDPITTERLSIYNESVLASNPLYGIKLTNSTGKHLLQGPVTVLESSAYAGDARIDNLPPGQHRFLSYGIDLQVLIKTNLHASHAHIQTATISKGILEFSEKLLNTKAYTIDNKSPRAKTLIIEHPIEPGYNLVDTPEPMEVTSACYRLRYDIPPAIARTITVQAQSVRSRSLTLVDEFPAGLQVFIDSGGVPATVKSGLQEIITRRRTLSDFQERISTIETQVADLTSEQSRIRDNIKTAPDNSPYQKRLLAKLNEQEDAFENLQSELGTLTQSRDTSAKDLSDYIASLSLK
jgi:hypothetical protein